jgi:hypothetical protein
VKYVTGPKQASVLNYHLISVATRLIMFVYNVCVCVCVCISVTYSTATISAMHIHRTEVPDNRHYRTTHCHCQYAITGRTVSRTVQHITLYGDFLACYAGHYCSRGIN